MKSIKLSLDTLLSEAGKTRYVLAKEIGISYPTIDHYYKNTITRYDKDILLKICTALNCGIEDLIKIVDE